MKRMKAIFAFSMAILMLFSAACGKEEPATETETAEEVQTEKDEQGLTAADRAYLDSYLADYESGKFDGGKLFDYEHFTEFVKDFEYKGLKYPEDPMIEVNVTDEEVDAYLTLFLLASSVPDEQYSDITDGAVQKYDVVEIDFRGLVDGKETEGTTATGQTLVIGSNTYIDGFESGLVGKKAGEEVRLDLKFSPYYQASDVAGKDVIFYVTVNKIQRPAIPELTVDVVNEYYQTEFKTVEEAKEWFKQALATKERNQSYSALSAYLQNKLLDKIEVLQYPDKEMAHYCDHFIKYHEQMKGDADWEAYCSESLGTSYEGLQKESETYAKEQIKSLLMAHYIAKAEELTCTADQIRAYIEGFYVAQNADGYYPDLKSMVEECTELYGADYFESQVIGAMVSEKIIEYAVKEAV